MEMIVTCLEDVMYQFSHREYADHQTVAFEVKCAETDRLDRREGKLIWVRSVC